MKMSDIPKLVFCQSNGTTSDLAWVKDMIEHFDKSYGIDLDPDFQRGHVWNHTTKVKFMEYLLRGGVIPPIRFNSPEFGGMPRAKNCDLPETIVLVDGKQRLTAILEFLDNKIAVFGGVYLKDFDKPEVLCRSVSFTYMVNRLQTRKELLQWYLELNEGQIAHTEEELDRVRKLMSE